MINMIIMIIKIIMIIMIIDITPIIIIPISIIITIIIIIMTRRSPDYLQWWCLSAWPALEIFLSFFLLFSTGHCQDGDDDDGDDVDDVDGVDHGVDNFDWVNHLYK